MYTFGVFCPILARAESEFEVGIPDEGEGLLGEFELKAVFTESKGWDCDDGKRGACMDALRDNPERSMGAPCITVSWTCIC